jgi:hypothetical protein
LDLKKTTVTLGSCTVTQRFTRQKIADAKNNVVACILDEDEQLSIPRITLLGLAASKKIVPKPWETRALGSSWRQEKGIRLVFFTCKVGTKVGFVGLKNKQGAYSEYVVASAMESVYTMPPMTFLWKMPLPFL